MAWLQKLLKVVASRQHQTQKWVGQWAGLKRMTATAGTSSQTILLCDSVCKGHGSVHIQEEDLFTYFTVFCFSLANFFSSESLLEVNASI